MRNVVLYSREGCCLCDEAREALLRVRARQAFALEEQDIEQDEELLRRYLERIPVITIDGRVAFELLVDERQLEQALSEAQAPDRR